MLLKNGTLEPDIPEFDLVKNFEDIEITSIEHFGTNSSFRVYTTIKNFIFAYTKANCAALKKIIPLVKYSKISVEELEEMVKKAFFAPV